jgi:broad specificity phosphatase PhoE
MGCNIDRMLNRRRFLFAPALLAVPAMRGAQFPRQVLLIRHAEKLETKADSNLSPRGLERAAALPRLFQGPFDPPGFIFASAPSKHSNRPVDTVTPLSRTLHLPINARYSEGAVSSLAKDVLVNPHYASATILICWHHGTLPALAEALKAPNRPPHWPDTQFDRVWKLEYADSKVTFSDLPQHLLPGDSQ